jgi:hypothetical protein
LILMKVIRVVVRCGLSFLQAPVCMMMQLSPKSHVIAPVYLVLVSPIQPVLIPQTSIFLYSSSGCK